ncbi:MAG: hypothetical protein HYW96_00775, partial [Candidatus Wildermuthbacteria bacterium]|nr:hypothetical protein [Candidatus Wildermuthbacteria bacterium]
MRKPRVTEEFLWKLFEFLEVVGDAHDNLFARRSLKDELNTEWRELRHVYERKQHKRSFAEFLSYLKGQGYIKIPSGESVENIQLTPKGVEKAFRGRAQEKALQPRKDGKLIMLMFDIPKRKERVRWAFRSALVFLDYQMLQKSV